MAEPLQRLPAGSALDARGLFEIGLECIRTLSHRGWTDHNTHDPGITMLEALSMALAELGYRATLPIEDLVARSAEAAVADEAIEADAPEPPPRRATSIAPRRCCRTPR